MDLNERRDCQQLQKMYSWCVVCKLLETIIRDHMVEFLVKHQLKNTFQHGFLKARSCLTNL